VEEHVASIFRVKELAKQETSVKQVASRAGNIYEMFLRTELPGLLEDVLLMTRYMVYFRHSGATPHYNHLVK
jgi:hypothetical protein